ncbi:hypothetical protein [Methyloferula stellata]|uniref:hypothetical protein n=1 Tax=Methyloferula stellata TaxID=876270 RepID=UPI000377805A|nr:hypothetical protein [Methyloferula stellata]
MAQLMRFGRRIALPSARQIRHELLMMMQDDQRRLAVKTPDVAAPMPLPGVEPLAVAV